MDLIPSLLPFIQTPILGFKSIHDHVVPPCSTDEIMNKIGSVKGSDSITNSYHVATMDDERNNCPTLF